MKHIVLLGDSIRQGGYGYPVAQRLAGDFTVWQPEENCRFAKYTHWMLWEWRNELEKADIIHWNNGLWDTARLFDDGIFTSKEQYVETMLRIAKELKKYAAIVIFATITPVRSTNPNQRNEDIIAYNAALVPELEKLGVVINDLHTAVAADIPRYIRADDHIHLTAEGVDLCAEQVERILRQQAETL